jgi:hypothetical protein
MTNKKIDEILENVSQLHYVAKTKNLEIDGYLSFRANTICYDYDLTVKKFYDRWDWALCQLNDTIESKLDYLKNQKKRR